MTPFTAQPVRARASDRSPVPQNQILALPLQGCKMKCLRNPENELEGTRRLYACIYRMRCVMYEQESPRAQMSCRWSNKDLSSANHSLEPERSRTSPLSAHPILTTEVTHVTHVSNISHIPNIPHVSHPMVHPHHPLHPAHHPG